MEKENHNNNINYNKDNKQPQQAQQLQQQNCRERTVEEKGLKYQQSKQSGSGTYSSEELLLNWDRSCSSTAEELEEFPYSSAESNQGKARYRRFYERHRCQVFLTIALS